MKIYKVFLSFLVILMISIPVAFASSSTEENTNPSIVATMMNSETGDIQRIEAISQVTDIQSNSENSEIDVNYSAFFPIPVPETRASDGKDKTEGGVTVSIHVTYTISANKELIKISQYSGSWTPSSSMFVVSNRDVGIHGGPYGDFLRKSPTTNSFNYVTGWGYHNFVTSGDASPYAWADATVTVIGMSGSHQLKLGMAFPDDR